jgi:hypothetical protein
MHKLTLSSGATREQIEEFQARLRELAKQTEQARKLS